LGKDGSVRDFSFAQLRDLTNRFANVLSKLGVGHGDRIYALMGRTPELYVTALGAFKNRTYFVRSSPHSAPSRSKRESTSAARRSW
jgi:acetyl-CoA synthetase